MINPFALFLYLNPVMRALNDVDFRKVIIKAGAISFAVLMIFLLLGEVIFSTVLKIRFESFRIFGGIVLFSFAYMYIVKGQKALLTLKENLDDLASEIALPFMVGAGTISLTLVVSEQFEEIMGTLIVAISVAMCVLTILFLKQFRRGLKKERLKVAFDKNMEILIRLNGFFVGAIGIDMIRSGIQSLLDTAK
jgi:multiple antibiotic resistance protein